MLKVKQNCWETGIFRNTFTFKHENYFSAYYLEGLEQYRDFLSVDSEDTRKS